jgi:tRNA G46 methylase TrmB
VLPAVRPLSASCALLCEQHCRKLQDIHGDLGETTALDIGCGTGGSCFELALR